MQLQFVIANLLSCENTFDLFQVIGSVVVMKREGGGIHVINIYIFFFFGGVGHKGRDIMLGDKVM